MLKDSTNSKTSALAVGAKYQLPVNFGSPLRVTLTSVAVFVLSQVLAVIIIALIAGITQGESGVNDLIEGSIAWGFATILLSESIAIAMVYKLIGATKASWSKIGLIKPRWKDLPIAGLGLVVYYAILLVASAIIYSLLPQIDTNQKQDLGFETVNTSLQYLITFISLVILPPIGEEILVRGYFFTGLRAKLKLFPSMMIVSTLFAIAHLQLGNEGVAPLWAAAINTFFLSIVLVYVREKTGSLWPCIYIHGLNNLVAFIYLFKDSLF
jgi:hypothetical protein